VITDPSALIGTGVRVEGTVPVFGVMQPVPLVHFSVGVGHGTLALPHVFNEPALVFVPVLIVVGSLAVLITLLPLAIVAVVGSKGEHSETFTQSVLPIALILDSARVDVPTSTVWSPAAELSFVNISILELVDPEPIG
jgi:hypothetical protein